MHKHYIFITAILMVTQTETHTSKNQPETYFLTGKDGTIYPLDPATGEPLSPDSPPESLLADEEFREGYDFLKGCSDTLHFTLMLSAHDSHEDIENAGIDLHAVAEALGESKGILFFEGPATQEERDKQRHMYNQVGNLPADEVPGIANAIRAKAQMSRGPDSFFLNNLAEIAGTKVHAFVPDYVKDSDRPADRTLGNWYQAIQTASQQPAADMEALDTLKNLYIGFVAYRDWYMVGKIGTALSELDKQGLLPEVIQSGLLVGSQHANIGRHLEKFGVEVTYQGSYGEFLDDDCSKQVVRSVGSTVLDIETQIDLTASMLRKRAGLVRSNNSF